MTPFPQADQSISLSEIFHFFCTWVLGLYVATALVLLTIPLRAFLRAFYGWGRW